MGATCSSSSGRCSGIARTSDVDAALLHELLQADREIVPSVNPVTAFWKAVVVAITFTPGARMHGPRRDPHTGEKQSSSSGSIQGHITFVVVPPVRSFQ